MLGLVLWCLKVIGQLIAAYSTVFYMLCGLGGRSALARLVLSQDPGLRAGVLEALRLLVPALRNCSCALALWLPCGCSAYVVQQCALLAMYLAHHLFHAVIMCRSDAEPWGVIVPRVYMQGSVQESLGELLMARVLTRLREATAWVSGSARQAVSQAGDESSTEQVQ